MHYRQNHIDTPSSTMNNDENVNESSTSKSSALAGSASSPKKKAHRSHLSSLIKIGSISSNFSEHQIRRYVEQRRAAQQQNDVASHRPHRRRVASFAGRFLIHFALKVADLALALGVGVYTFHTLDKYVFLPTYRTFRCADLDGISHAYNENTVSAKTVMLCGLVLPYIIIEVCEWIFVRAAMPAQSSTLLMMGQMANSTIISLKYLLGFTVHILLMQCFKAYIGRLRPNFIAMCKPNWKQIGVDCMRELPETLISNAHCTNSNEWELQGRSSFPSGHASATTFVCVFIILYAREMTSLCRHVQETQNMGADDTVRLAKHALAHKMCRYMRRTLTPVIILWTLFVCASRVYDRWHHPTDVLGGIVLGFTTAYATFGMHTLQHAIDARHLHARTFGTLLQSSFNPDGS